MPDSDNSQHKLASKFERAQRNLNGSSSLRDLDACSERASGLCKVRPYGQIQAVQALAAVQGRRLSPPGRGSEEG